jgi:Fe-S cluster assembly protein SufD
VFEDSALTHDPYPAWVVELRRLARERFDSMPWPTPMEEEWRRIDVSELDLLSFDPLVPPPHDLPSVPTSASLYGKAGMLRLEAGVREIVRLSEELRDKGVVLLSLDAALSEFEDRIRPPFESAIREADNRFIPWHYATLGYGALLYVPSFVEIADPILIELIDGGSGRLGSPHVIVILDKGAKATVVQRMLGPMGGDFLLNAGHTLVVSEGAGLGFYRSQEMGRETLVFGHGSARVERDASITHIDAALGGRLVKTRIDCVLAGPGAEVFLGGAYFCARGQHMDIGVVQRHRSGKANSRAFYKGAVKEDGRAVFQGLIDVGVGASETDAYLSNRNLILSEGARSESIPSLKIGNNDVRCSHGSTTGRIDDEHLYYLMSRGLSEADAREMIVLGYFEEVLAGSPEAYQSAVLGSVRGRLVPG